MICSRCKRSCKKNNFQTVVGQDRIILCIGCLANLAQLLLYHYVSAKKKLRNYVAGVPL